MLPHRSEPAKSMKRWSLSSSCGIFAKLQDRREPGAGSTRLLSKKGHRPADQGRRNPATCPGGLLASWSADANAEAEAADAKTAAPTPSPIPSPDTLQSYGVSGCTPTAVQDAAARAATTVAKNRRSLKGRSLRGSLRGPLVLKVSHNMHPSEVSQRPLRDPL